MLMCRVNLCVQGVTTPRLVFAGYTTCGQWYLLFTQRLFGRHLEAGRDAHLRPTALAALRPLHAAGLCHGDVRLENFMVVGDAAGGEVRWGAGVGWAGAGRGGYLLWVGMGAGTGAATTCTWHLTPMHLSCYFA